MLEKYIYIYRNVTFDITYNLPGVFLENKYPKTVNGSIWVLPFFVGSYLFILSLKLIGVLKDTFRGFITVFTIAILAIFFYNMKFRIFWYDYNSFCILISILFGCALCCLRNMLVIDLRLLVGVVILFFIFKSTLLVYPFKLMMLFIASLWLSKLTVFLNLKPPINISLGLFLYAFPVQQALSCWFIDSKPLFNFVASLIITSVMSLLSYYCIERHCYKYAYKVNAYLEKNKIVL